MMNTVSLPYRLIGPTLLISLFVLSLLCGCRRGLDPDLTLADSKMEEHPDSSMALLNRYRLTPESTATDSAYYALLLTHARYKNFIDETDDSLISASADYFLRHGDSERASRALFLKGIIQMNAGRLGEAAVSFRNGLDVAREGRHYMWEGQCARGLFIIYGKIKNFSEQIIYAQAEYDAFVKGKYQDWTNSAQLNILRAYLNHGQYDSVLTEARFLLTAAEEATDTILMEDVLVLMGTCRYALGDFKGALDSYFNAYSLNPSVIRANHGYNVAVIADNIRMDSLSDGVKAFIKTVASRKETLPAFKVLASQGRFEEAFYGLERYKNYQDSVLRVIRSNNVSESINRYEDTMAIVRQKEVRIERIVWGTGILILVIAIGVSFLIYRKNLHQKELERKNMELTMEILQTDLASQMNHLNDMAADMRMLNMENERMSTALQDMLYERYKRVNNLCDSYFQDRIVESKRKKLEKEMENILKDFSNPDFLKEAGRFMDLCLDGLYTSFVEDFPDLKEDSRRLFMFLTLGLSNRAICVIMDVENSNLYNRKSRLKKFIAGSDAIRKEDYLKNIR